MTAALLFHQKFLYLLPVKSCLIWECLLPSSRHIAPHLLLCFT